jgi:hypothetical protein
MKLEEKQEDVSRLFHPSSLRPHPFLSDAAASDLDGKDQRRSFAGAY